MPRLARNADGDELLFVHAGDGAALLRFRPPRRSRRRLHHAAARHDVAAGDREPVALLHDRVEQRRAIRCRTRDSSVRTRSSIRPCWTRRASTPRSGPSRSDGASGRCDVKRRGADLRRSRIPYNPLDAVGWHGELAPVRINVRRPPSGDEPSLPPAAFGAHDVPVGPLRRLHVRAAPLRDAILVRSRCRSSTTTTITTR